MHDIIPFYSPADFQKQTLGSSDEILKNIYRKQNQSGHNPTNLPLAAARHQSDQPYIPLQFSPPVSLYFHDVQTHKQLLSSFLPPA